uniref:Uncharacterized protein n=1 Tax=Salix viminalis TaxID=40686 RepID=A0A6N2KL61_SALVM
MRKVCIVEEATDLVGAEMHRQNRILGLVEAKHPKPKEENQEEFSWNITRCDHLSPGSVLEASFSMTVAFQAAWI